MQLSLWDQFEPRPDFTFRTARLLKLGAGAWVEFVPEWLTGHHDLLQLLVATADWELHRRPMYDRMVEVPRLVAGAPGGEALSFPGGEVTRFRSRASRAEVARASALLHQMSALLSARYQRDLGQISLGYYRNGADSVAYHGDKLGPLRGDCVVAIASVGERRTFLMRPSAAHPERAAQRPRRFSVGSGDLLVMGGSCQATWEHAVPKARSAAGRIAIMFRPSPAQIARIPRGRGGDLPSPMRASMM